MCGTMDDAEGPSDPRALLDAEGPADVRTMEDADGPSDPRALVDAEDPLIRGRWMMPVRSSCITRR
jgi:hypothetical protein